MTPLTTAISLIRHGMVHNPQKIIYGRLPRYRLSAKGIEDARRAAKMLQNVHLQAVYCSPLLRTRQTAAEILRYHPGLALRTSSLITEVHTVFEGKEETCLKRFSGDVFATQDHNYEQPADIVKRSLKFLQILRKRHENRYVAVVTHGDVILFLLLWACGSDITPQAKLQLERISEIAEYPATGSITTFRFTSMDLHEKPSFTYARDAA